MLKIAYYFIFIVFGINNLTAQAFPDRHSTSYIDAWVSCQVAPSPNPDNPSGHWILYNLINVYPLGQTTIWNYNDPMNLDRGINEYEIALSTDGITWTSAENFNLEISEGSTFYQGELGPHLGDVQARYVLLTAISNYGGACFGLSELRINVDGIALPVELIDFSLKCIDGEVRLEWSTASEVNNRHFEIQRSVNGKEWVALAKINGSGNSNDFQSYSFKDKEPLSNGYYRLLQQDLDGKQYYHDVKSVSCGESQFRILASPNPVFDKTLIALEGFNEDLIEYTLSDVSGKIWMTNEWSLDRSPTLQLDLSNLPNGSYILNVKQEEVIRQQQLIKVGDD